jgi:hypothetical protein
MKQLFEFRKESEKKRETEDAALSEKLSSIQISQAEFTGIWKPKVDQAIGDLSSTVDYLKERVEHIDRQVATAVAGTSHGAAASTPATAVARSGHGVVNLVQLQPPLLPGQAPPLIGSGSAATAPNGHRHRLENRGYPQGPPGNGTVKNPETTPDPSRVLDFDVVDGGLHSVMGSVNRSDIPNFDGDNPKWWKRNCEKYFKMSRVHDMYWKDLATMNFVGQATLWL